ncbi:hypothetical protein DPM13_12920 [Paracoccus mutanolyticus]|uniref:Uncharacterized protein n=1 Tax=Paracoccus mutanolyticus TaxID=1499308 RepID=A0ABM6WSM8_9RHOB|nr:hypothetical protein [Paracoccus mutanolyticus]AWX93664.1 hypothetical protein DPM13_12920 [Paracoccus mutanolyticus]
MAGVDGDDLLRAYQAAGVTDVPTAGRVMGNQRRGGQVRPPQLAEIGRRRGACQPPPASGRRRTPNSRMPSRYQAFPYQKFGQYPGRVTVISRAHLAPRGL